MLGLPQDDRIRDDKGAVALAVAGDVCQPDGELGFRAKQLTVEAHTARGEIEPSMMDCLVVPAAAEGFEQCTATGAKDLGAYLALDRVCRTWVC